MKILICHSSDIDYENDLYIPFRTSSIAKEHELILPYTSTSGAYDVKHILKNNDCDVMIAESSDCAVGLGIEMGWANAYDIRIVCVYKRGSQISGALKLVSDVFLEYDSKEDMLQKINLFLKGYEQSTR